jgi:hypothetical protein
MIVLGSSRPHGWPERYEPAFIAAGQPVVQGTRGSGGNREDVDNSERTKLG